MERVSYAEVVRRGWRKEVATMEDVMLACQACRPEDKRLTADLVGHIRAAKRRRMEGEQ